MRQKDPHLTWLGYSICGENAQGARGREVTLFMIWREMIMSSPKRQRRPFSLQFQTPPPLAPLSPCNITSPIPMEIHSPPLSFSSFPGALPYVAQFHSPPSRSQKRAAETNEDTFFDDNSSIIRSSPSFPDYSPVIPHTPHRSRVFDDSFGLCPELHSSTLSAHSTSSSLPLPDQSAFDTSLTYSRKGTPRRSQVCPPTPIRTPAWAHEGSLNSELSTTKLLVSLCSTPEYESFNDSVSEDYFSQEFENLGWLGCGVFANVFKMKSHSDGQVYAVKKSNRQFRSRRDRDRLLQEVRTYEKILNIKGYDCEYIIKYYRAWQEDGYLFSQSELCARGNLREFVVHLDRGIQLLEATIWHFIHDIAQGLSYIHDAGIVHLDIKPQNIFIAENGMLKIGDFGVATEFGHIEDGLEGDTLYMARELLTSGKKMPSADIFSLGAMIYEIASGIDLPQEGDRWHELRERCDVSVLSGYTSELGNLVFKMMSPDPNLRPTAHEILQNPVLSKMITVPDGDFVIKNTTLHETNLYPHKLFTDPGFARTPDASPNPRSILRWD